MKRNKMLFAFSLLFSISLILWGVSNKMLNTEVETNYKQLNDVKVSNDVLGVYENINDITTNLVVTLPNNSNKNIIGAKNYFETYVIDQVLLNRDGETYHQFNLLLLDEHENLIEACVYTDTGEVITVSKTKKPFINFK